MTAKPNTGRPIGWIGMGRMGYPMAERLLKAGHDVAVYNRTRSKAEPLAKRGARIVDAPADLARSAVLFTMVSTSDDLKHVLLGENGLLAGRQGAPGVVVDCSSISEELSVEIRRAWKPQAPNSSPRRSAATANASAPASSASSPPARARPSPKSRAC